VAGGGGGAMGGETVVGQPWWKERRAMARPNPEPGQNSKRNSFRISIDFEFGRTLENCTRRFRMNLTWGFFLKSSRLSKILEK
jgi:hypothetical protein